MRETIISDPANVYVDGVNVGAVADAIANRPELAPDIQRALAAHYSALIETQSDQLAAFGERVAAVEEERDLAVRALGEKVPAAVDAKAVEN